MATETNTTGQQVILNNGINQHLLTIPDGGLLVRLNVEGQQLRASFEEGANQPGMALQIITWALERLQVDPVLDTHHPFAVYNPGVFASSRPASETEAP